MAVIRYARIRVSVEILRQLLVGDWSALCASTTAPADLQVVGVEQPAHAVNQWFYVICESKTFKPVPELAEIPDVGPFEYTDKRAGEKRP